MNKTNCGLIAIVGRPNVGKSTLMNHLIGQKVSITSRKPQTTQHKINGIRTLDNNQFVFIDTPGYQLLYKNKINDLLNNAVIAGLNTADVVFFVIEAMSFNAGDAKILELLKTCKQVVLVINKIDKVLNPLILNEFINDIKTKFSFVHIATVSSKTHKGVDALLNDTIQFLPNGPFLYDKAALTDKNERFLVAEIIREKLFRNLGQELPYQLTVVIDDFLNDSTKSHEPIVKISANIMVTRTNHKAIVIGTNGTILKKISTSARIDIEKLLDSKVFLELWVKVKPHIMDSEHFLEQFK